VDDEKDTTDVIKLAFEGQDSNLIVDTYNNPLLALQNFRKGIYDFILLDIRMKPIDGIELYKKVRNIDKKVKVFIFTATDPRFEEYRKVCSSFEERYFIQKPISLRKLLHFVKSGVM
jgi:two-component system, OmpR family, response regulator ChvI